ncbi:hypothetical protein SteCoe_5373 [Stentor coeruleus]|uniref:Translation initiation factor 3 N-terminal domain-containing protein n=1 Tax=Stentor coeruleus TaxID=5963 RepID=A0A1R2CSI6_9CILI|nr:hypothetical protein SteCoe_5373 [Stentor coeruleus]
MLLRRTILRAVSKNFKSLNEFSDREKKKLERVFLDDEIAEFFRWKRYPINDQISFEGEAKLISWENFKIGETSLEEAREAARNEKLDLVLVKKEPPVVRIMNYRNWILRWALQDHEIKTSYDKKKSAPIFKISHRITDADIEVKINRFNELLKTHNMIVVESSVLTTSSVDEINSLRKFEVEFPKKIRPKLSNKSVWLKIVSGEFSVKIIIKTATKEKEYAYYSLALNESSESWEKVEVFETYNHEKDEEAFMNSFLNGDFAPKNADNLIAPEVSEISQQKVSIDYIDHSLGTDFIGDDSIDNTNKEVEYVKDRIRKLLGDELAAKFLKGRLKV